MANEKSGLCSPAEPKKACNQISKVSSDLRTQMLQIKIGSCTQYLSTQTARETDHFHRFPTFLKRPLLGLYGVDQSINKKWEIVRLKNLESRVLNVFRWDFNLVQAIEYGLHRPICI